MSIEAFLRQGFIPFTEALHRQEEVLALAVDALQARARGVAEQLADEHRLTFMGIGASYAALGAPVAALRTRGIDAVRANPAELDGVEISHTLVALSQSGRSRETVEILRRAGGRKVAVVNITDSPLAEDADLVLSMGDLPDSLASSIGFSSTAIAVSLLAEGLTDGVSEGWASIPQRQAAFAASVASSVADLAPVVAEAGAIDIVAPIDFAGAAEVSALLLREVARVPAAPFEARQYLHGQMESTRDDTLHILIGGSDSAWIEAELVRLGRRVVHLVPEGMDASGAAAIRLPSRSVLETPLFVAAFAQRLALAAAQHCGIDPDDFRFLDTGTKLGDDE